MPPHPMLATATLLWTLLRRIWLNTLVLDPASYAREPLAVRTAAAHRRLVPTSTERLPGALAVRACSGWGSLS